MKILWLITKFDYKQKNPYVGCGWVNALLDNITLLENVEIGLVFFSDKVKILTIHEEGKYVQFVIPSYLNRIDKVVRNITFKDYLFDERESILLSVINKFNPDIIHVFGTENPFGLIALKTKIPVLIHIQGILNPLINKWFPAGYNNLLITRNTSLIKLIKLSGFWTDYIRNKKLAHRERKIISITKFFSGRTDWDQRIVELMSKSSKYYHCDEILRPTFYISQWSIPKNSDSIRVISIINPNMYKGIETILETAKLLKTYTNFKISWIVAGIEQDNLLVKIFTHKTKIIASSVNVEFIGPIQETTIIKEMLISNIFVHPSHIDNSPNSLCEAMMLGMPIVSSNVGGIQSLITDKQEGLLVQDGEAYSFAGAILELIKNPSKSESYGKAARQRAIERHNPIKIVNKQLFIYKDILKIYDPKSSLTTYLP
jgi:glycosyltransferase involved in cell wall biosynthesis